MGTRFKFKKRISEEYERFLEETTSLISKYGDTFISKYLTMHRSRISAQIATMLKLIEGNGWENRNMLSLGGWPAVAPIILHRITGIHITLLDHPALLTGTITQFYADNNLKTVPFDFAEAAKTPVPLSETFQLIECCQCIEHWNFNPVPFFRQIFSTLLDPAGSLFLTVPNAISLYRRLAILAGRNPYPAIQSFIDADTGKPGAEISPHWHEYTRNDLKMLIEYTGGVCSEIRTVTYPVTNRSLPHRIYSFFSNIHPALRENIEVICIHHPLKDKII